MKLPNLRNHLRVNFWTTRRGKTVIGYGVIFLWMFLPMIPVVIAGAIGGVCGCQVDEAGPHPCIVFGRNIGGTLAEMGEMGWFGLVTLPTGFLALILFASMTRKSGAIKSSQ